MNVTTSLEAELRKSPTNSSRTPDDIVKGPHQELTTTLCYHTPCWYPCRRSYRRDHVCMNLVEMWLDVARDKANLMIVVGGFGGSRLSKAWWSLSSGVLQDNWFFQFKLYFALGDVFMSLRRLIGSLIWTAYSRVANQKTKLFRKMRSKLPRDSWDDHKSLDEYS